MNRGFIGKNAILILIITWILPIYAWGQSSLAPLVRRVQPAVVTITTFNISGESVALGSGFFINKTGLLITNHHVIEGAFRIMVEGSDGKKYKVRTVINEDKAMDLACLLVDITDNKIPYLNISGAIPEVGDRIMVIGSPLGLEQTVSDGVVSAVRTISGLGEILQISAPISPGSSGGPVVNLKGEVIGVATFQAKVGQNLNFAIPGYRVLAIKKRAENTLKEQYIEEKAQEPSQSVDYDHFQLLYFEYYNKGVRALEKAKNSNILLNKRRAMDNYGEAIMAFKMALTIKPNDLYAKQKLIEANSGLERLKKR